MTMLLFFKHPAIRPRDLLAKSLLLGALLAGAAQAQVGTAGTMVVVPAYGEVTHANDEATLTLSAEEEDKDKRAAESRVNKKMKQGIETLRRADPSAKLTTEAYRTYAVYPEEKESVQISRSAPRKPVAWRVTQDLQVVTTNLAALESTANAAQAVLNITRVRFGISARLTKQLDDARVAATYGNLNERIASIARAMGRKPADAMLELVDFDGTGAFAMPAATPGMQRIEVTGSRIDPRDLAEPSFEPGETTLKMRLVGKVKFR